ncbi:hypothetical protein ScalyP_jg8203 [Parmales sp. scaly parma]|nr:hypothetical protein ScalyP_jg8203 [Parmales sp. scaly parma]
MATVEECDSAIASILSNNSGLFLSLPLENLSHSSSSSLPPPELSTINTLLSSLSTCSSADNLESYLTSRTFTITNSNSLFALLSLPQLFTASLSQPTYHKDAVQILATIQRLEVEYSDTNSSNRGDDNNPKQQILLNQLVSNVCRKVRLSEPALKSAVLKRLCPTFATTTTTTTTTTSTRTKTTTITISESMEVVGILRRLNSLSTSHNSSGNNIMLSFLESRDLWLVEISSPPQNSTFDNLLASVESFRGGIFEIATQFLAIFDEAEVEAGVKAQPTPNNNNNLSLLAIYTSRRCHAFLNEILGEMSTHPMTGPQYRSLLDAVTFLGSTLSRVGASGVEDFFLKAVEEGVIEQVLGGWRDGVHRFETSVRMGVGNFHLKKAARRLWNEGYVDEKGEQSTSTTSTTSLLQFPPLASLLNCFLARLNSLRLILLPGIVPRLKSATDDIVLQGAAAVMKWAEKEARGKRTDDEKLEEVISDMKGLFDTVFTPAVKESLAIALLSNS